MNFYDLKKQIDDDLLALFDKLKKENKYADTELLAAMEYSVMNGGKRIRPILCLLSSELIAGSIKSEVTFLALAIELVHSYSLIHDDLPCMDNDDLRRGIPTTHKKFGEATALLAGDALLNLAFEIALRGVEMSKNPSNYTRAMSLMFSCTGYNGMIGGQTLDLSLEGKPIDDETYSKILRMYDGKTANLLIAAMLGGAVASGAGEEETKDLYEFAFCLGLAFQIKDDILDLTSTTEKLGKKVGSDDKNEKVTLLRVSNLSDVEQIYAFYNQKALDILNKFGENKIKIAELYNFLVNREY